MPPTVVFLFLAKELLMQSPQWRRLEYRRRCLLPYAMRLLWARRHWHNFRQYTDRVRSPGLWLPSRDKSLFGNNTKRFHLFLPDTTRSARAIRVCARAGSFVWAFTARYVSAKTLPRIF